MSKILEQLKKMFDKIKTKLFNYKKYIIKFEILDDKLKILNSDNEYTYVDNSLKNKVKLMEIIKEHKEEIDLKIIYYEKKKEDYEIILFVNAFVLIALGFIFIFSFFIGDIMFFLLALTITCMYLLIFINYTSRILTFKEEIKRLKKFYKKNNNS